MCIEDSLLQQERESRCRRFVIFRRFIRPVCSPLVTTGVPDLGMNKVAMATVCWWKRCSSRRKMISPTKVTTCGGVSRVLRIYQHSPQHKPSVQLQTHPLAAHSRMMIDKSTRNVRLLLALSLRRRCSPNVLLPTFKHRRCRLLTRFLTLLTLLRNILDAPHWSSALIATCPAGKVGDTVFSAYTNSSPHAVSFPNDLPSTNSPLAQPTACSHHTATG